MYGLSSERFDGRAFTPKVFVSFAAIFAVFACSQPLVLKSPPPDKVLNYDSVMSRWTRSDALYGNFETEAKVYATFFSQEFIQAYIQEYVRIYNPTEDEIHQLKNKFDSYRASKACFFLALLTQDRRANDLALGNSVWHIYLTTSTGHKLRPNFVAEVAPVTAMYEHFFPYFTNFFQGYEVYFGYLDAVTGLPKSPLSPGTPVKYFVLSMHSPFGSLRLNWELE